MESVLVKEEMLLASAGLGGPGAGPGGAGGPKAFGSAGGGGGAAGGGAAAAARRGEAAEAVERRARVSVEVGRARPALF